MVSSVTSLHGFSENVSRTGYRLLERIWSRWSDTEMAGIALLIAALVIPRILTISNTVAPARDAFRYWQAAYQLEHEPFPASLGALEVSPLYPCSLMILQWVTKPVDPHTWLWTNQVFNVASYVVFLLLAYQVGSWVWSPGIAFWGCLAVGLLPRQIAYSCDVLSDSLFAALWMLSFGFVVWSLRQLTSKGRSLAPLGMAAAGVAAGLAYLTRVEGLLLPLVLSCTLLVMTRRFPTQNMALLGVTFFLPFICLAGLYFVLAGHVSPRNSAQALLGGPTVPENRRWDHATLTIGTATIALQEDTGESPRRLSSSGIALFKELMQETRGWLFMLAVCGTASWLRRPPPIHLLLPVSFACLGCGLMLWLLHYKAGYLASRYLTPILPLLGMLGVVGVSELWKRVTVDLRFPWERHWHSAELRFRRRLVFAVGLGMLAASLTIPRWLKPLHLNRSPHMQAAAWLRAHSQPEDRVFDPLVLTSYFAVRHAWWPTPPLPTIFPCRFAVIDPTVLGWCDDLLKDAIVRMCRDGRLVATFAGAANKEGAVFIFELDRTVAQDERRGAD